MKTAKLLLFACSFFALSMLTSSCAKEGCTNEFSENYDADAKEDDGTCTLFREKFIGQYNVSESCPSGNFTYTMNIVASTTADNAVIINNLAGSGVPVNATVDQSAITIPNQNITANGIAIAINGNGSISGSILTLSITYNIGGAGETCTETCTKQ